MITQAFCTSFKQQLLEGVHDFRVGQDVFKIALYDESAYINASTTAYTTAGEIVASGYSAGGLVLTNIAPTQYNLAGVCSFATVTWTGVTFSARGALIYNTTPSSGSYINPACVVLDFGMMRPSQNGIFQITFAQATDATAVIRIN